MVSTRTTRRIGCAVSEKRARFPARGGSAREQRFHSVCSLSGEQPPYFYMAGKMPNARHTPYLSDDAIVELPAPCWRDGIAMHKRDQPRPLFSEAWVRQHRAINELRARAALEGSRQAAIEAIVCDPTVRDSDCSAGQLLDEMLEANRGLVPVRH